ncbi:CRISPR-associated endonuclease Cas2 [Kyrpidia sp.]|uniref:CRISPR-associated endonuclease Cas2 n=1 Tax=Kyrpidia sp. TaxID=2073077 RepID=UPI002582D40B|nr:CRISPR-associated endonuclease Cas2 [Kyrpidia sp.]MCL6576737.1 CRISPR-associated endonuclease Cas2 [Kyrpidia sp.]
MYVIACYDVPAKRTEKYRKLLARYLIGIQESVFVGDLTDTQFRALQRDTKMLYTDEDYIIWITTENRRNVRLEHWKEGRRMEDADHLGSAVL